MKIYLLCTLDSEHYREPYFYFFEAAFAAHKWVIDNLVSITEESREEVISELEYKNVDGSDDQIMRIDYSYGDGEFYVNTIHENSTPCRSVNVHVRPLPVCVQLSARPACG